VLLISLICHTPIVIRGQHVNWSPISRWDVRNNRRWRDPFVILERVLARWWCLVTFMKAMNLLHRAMHAVLYCRIATAIEMASKGGGACCSLLCWLCSWRPPGPYGASSRPMAEFSGFYESPGPPSSGDVLPITPAHRHGHQNCPQWRCICSPPPPISIAVIVAKDHVMVHLN